MSNVIDALAQWDALARREVATHNRVKLASDTSCAASELGMPPQTGHNTNNDCPSLWRDKIVEWCFQVVDHCEFGRDVVSYAMSYFDRIFPYYSINDTLVELVALTCLYLALKIHCSNKISLRCILSFSGSSFQYDQVLKMERIILRGLDWHLHPATPHSFLEIFFSTSSSDDKEMNEIEETANYLLELAICDAFFVSKKPSCVSSAAILAAMDIVRRPLRVNAMMENLLVNNDRCMVEACSKRLKEIYSIMIKQSAAQELGAVNSDSPISVVNVA